MTSFFDDYPITGEPIGHVGPPQGQSIEQAFLVFHEANPHVYHELVRLTRQLAGRGHTKIGIGMLFEVLRWQHALQTSRASDFKLNNNFRSYYARLIMTNEPDLEGIFETRRLHV